MAMPECVCLNCGEHFMVAPCRIRKGLGHYCSHACANNAPGHPGGIPSDQEDKVIADYLSGLSFAQVAERSGFSVGAVRRLMKRRHIPSRSTSEALKGKTKSTSHRAALSASSPRLSGKKNPAFSKTPKANGAYVDHLGKHVRSRREYDFAVFLHRIDINHEYETHRIMIDENTTYLPDFYLPDYDLHVELKSCMEPRFKRILALIRQSNRVRLWVIMGYKQPQLLESPDLFYTALLAAIPPTSHPPKNRVLPGFETLQ